MNFYSNQIAYVKRQAIREELETRILSVTEGYISIGYIRDYVREPRLPYIVLDICRRRKDWKAEEKYRSMVSESPDTPPTYRSLNLDNELVSELRRLTSEDQQHVLLYVLLVLRVERSIRNFIRRECLIHDVDLSTTAPEEALSRLTLPELFEMLLSDKVKPFLKDLSLSVNEWVALKVRLSGARNSIAHARVLDMAQMMIAVNEARQLLDRLDEFDRRVSQGYHAKK